MAIRYDMTVEFDNSFYTYDGLEIGQGIPFRQPYYQRPVRLTDRDIPSVFDRWSHFR